MITITENLTTVTISVVKQRKILRKVDKIVGKGLSTEDYTTAEKQN
jgi:hypothetical protein